MSNHLSMSNQQAIIGLSAHIVCRQGASKPANHMSRTITILKASLASLNRFASLRRASLLRMCFCYSGPSSALPVRRSANAEVRSPKFSQFDIPNSSFDIFHSVALSATARWMS